MHHGSCHCGNVVFSVEWTPENVFECDCSHCSRKWFLLWFVPRGGFTLEPVAMPLSSYKFHKHVIEHEFCPTCGVQCFAYGTDPSSGASMVAVNTRCLQDIDLAAVPRVAIHGKDF